MNGVIYTTTAQGCGGNPNQFYSYDLATKKVGSYNPGSGGMWPRSGPSVGKDGTVYAGSGDGDYYPERQIYGQAIIGVKQNAETKALELKDWYAPSNALLAAQARSRHERDRAHLRLQGQGVHVQSSKECRLWLLDTAMLGGEDHRTPVYRTPLVCNEEVNFTMGVWGALATWEDTAGRAGCSRRSGARSIRSSRRRSSTDRSSRRGRRVQGRRARGKVQLVPAWISRNMSWRIRR